MANGMVGEADGCTFQWKIENISQCWWLQKGKSLQSPTFVADSIQSTKWRIMLYSIDVTDEDEFSFYLCREDNCSGPDNIEIKFDLAFLDEDGEFLQVTSSRRYPKYFHLKFSPFDSREIICLNAREALLPEDTLTVQCTIWNNKEGKPVKSKHIYAKTIFRTYRKPLMWRIDNFSSRKFAAKNKLKNDVVDFDIVLNEISGFDKEIVIIQNSFDKCLEYFSLKTSIVNSEGKRKNCGWKQYFVDDLKKRVLSLTLNLPENLRADKSLYLPNDILSLYCEFVFVTETAELEIWGNNIPSAQLKNERSQNTTFLADDLKSLFNDGIFSDMELRTSTQTFPVHKNILSARSAVFRRMFSSDMKEKNSGHVDITDLKDDIVRRMLLYIYFDSLEDLQCESACKLYAAADKYDIQSLKNGCSSFLKENLCQTDVCNILILADQHQDNDLKTHVEDYILNRDEVFRTTEWMQLMNTNSKLAADVMYRKINL